MPLCCARKPKPRITSASRGSAMQEEAAARIAEFVFASSASGPAGEAKNLHQHARRLLFRAYAVSRAGL